VVLIIDTILLRVIVAKIGPVLIS